MTDLWYLRPPGLLGRRDTLRSGRVSACVPAQSDTLVHDWYNDAWAGNVELDARLHES